MCQNDKEKKEKEKKTLRLGNEGIFHGTIIQ
jgi:hypothetical protein